MRFSTFGGIRSSAWGGHRPTRWRTEYEGLMTIGVHGFHVTLPNGNTVSVQWGPGNYSSNYSASLMASREAEKRGEEWTSTTAEIAAWRDIREGETPARKDADTMWHTFDCGDQVRGRLSPERVLEFLDFAADNELDVRERKYDYYLDEVVIVGHLTLRQKVLRGWFKFLEWKKRANRPEGEKE